MEDAPQQQPAGLGRGADRLLGLVPLAIAILWVAGVARFRDYQLEPIHWLSLVAFAFAMQVLGKRIRRERPAGRQAAPAAPVAPDRVGSAGRRTPSSSIIAWRDLL